MEGNKKKILIVDDDERHLITAKELLEEEGYEVITHLGCFGATAQVMKYRPDLVLLDINMPALSGEKLSSIIMSMEKTKYVPIVFYSSNDEDTLRLAVLKHNVMGYICKGDILELKRKVSYYLTQ